MGDSDTLLADLHGKPYTYQHEEQYERLREVFNKIIASGADSLYGDLVMALRKSMHHEMDGWIPAEWARDLSLADLGSLLLVEWMRE